MWMKYTAEGSFYRMRKNKEYIIWSSLIDLDEWDANEELYDNRLDRYERACELNSMHLDDERVNL